MSFQFKQFYINDNLAAMKVGADSVILGCWMETNNCKEIIDVGTGSGLLMLMAAQKNQTANLWGIELNQNAFSCAKINIKNAPFKNDFNLIHGNWTEWDTEIKFDLFICNPPYFAGENNNLDIDRRNARYSKYLSLNDFFLKCKNHASKMAKIAMIYPYSSQNELINEAVKNNWYPNKLVYVKGNREVKPKRILIEFSTFKKEIEKSELIIEESRNNYTTEYQKLTQDFLLDKEN